MKSLKPEANSQSSPDANYSLYSFELEYRSTVSLPENNKQPAQILALRHRSGAQLYIVACSSQESAFSYCFATPAENDKGLAHIVEHVVFCGSTHYPLKEPFANLQKTSVCSFLNAMTYPDQTVYPAASSFASDFLQLLRVYGDAVFFPLLEQQAIAQEGVRQAREGWDGIVFNEMQGYYGDFEAYVADCSLRSLFPREHPNSFDAGGNPQAIATIDCSDYHEVRNFHRRHYQPENCRIIMYGSIPQQHLDEILHYLDSQLLCALPSGGATVRSATGQVALRQELYQSVAVAQPSKKQRSIMFSWLLPAQRGAQSSLEYRLLAELLLGHSGAVLELPIMHSGWGADLSLGSGLELELQNPVLRVGLSAYELKDGHRFRKLIFFALEEFCTQVEQGPSTEQESLWQGALNSLEYEEYSMDEHGGEDGICALERCLQLARTSHFYQDTQEIFAILQPFGSIAALRNEGLVAFAAKVRRYTLANPHWTLQLFEEVAAKPQAPKRTLEDLAQRQEAFIKYQARQDEPEHSAKITAMSRDAFGNRPPKPQCEYVQEQTIDFFCSGRPTEASLVQIDFYWEISTWSEAQSVLLPLFLDLVEDMGLPGLSYAEVAKRKSQYIGHWEAEFHCKPVFRHYPEALRSFVHIQLSFLPTEWREGLLLFWKLLANCNWEDQGRLRELLKSSYYEKSQSLCSNPLGYVARRSCYRLSQVADTPQSSQLQARHSEFLYGLGQLELLAQIWQQGHVSQVAESFCQLRQALLQAPLSCAISAAQQQLGALRQAIVQQHEFWQQPLPEIGNELQNKAWADIVCRSFPDTALQNIELWQGSIALEHLSIAIPAPKWSYSDCEASTAHPAMELLVKLLQNGPAWERIRLQQGAYGVRVQQQSGFFLLCSSQDPNALGSIGLFRQAVEDIRDKIQHPDFLQEFEAALVQTLAEKLKAPLHSEHARITLHLARTGLKYDDSQEWLEQLRQMQLQDLLWVTEYVLQAWSSARASCIFAASGRIARYAHIEYHNLPHFVL